jgi:hypothetical protein
MPLGVSKLRPPAAGLALNELLPGGYEPAAEAWFVYDFNGTHYTYRGLVATEYDPEARELRVLMAQGIHMVNRQGFALLRAVARSAGAATIRTAGKTARLRRAYIRLGMKPLSGEPDADLVMDA